MNRAFDVTTSWTASAVRGGAGLVARKLGPRPEQPLELYEFEACPYCRKVRDALSELDLEARIYPCPKGGQRYRPWVVENGGKRQFPYLVDPNTGDAMYESDDIVAHLFRRYGDGGPPPWVAGPLATTMSAMSSIVRPARGGRARPSKTPEQPLELYSFEASPFCRIVREELCSLEVPYLLHNVAKRSPSREAFVRRSRKMMVPWLADPNTGTEMFESADIVRYLRDTYGAA